MTEAKKRKGWGSLAVRPDALQEMRELHLLRRCPSCGNRISKPRISTPTPFEGTPGSGGGYYLESMQSQVHHCRLCDITWTLSLRSLTYQRNAFGTHTHSLRLTARRAHVCKCKCCMTQSELLLDDEMHGDCRQHSKLGFRCPSLGSEGTSTS